jgi:uncharacterized membrane protein YfcA
MDELLKLLLLFGIGSLAGFINIMAGGGSAITLPALIFLGLEGSLANGTNRVAIVIQNIAAVLSFRQERYQKFKLSLKLAAFTLPGAVTGALIATTISDELFQKILAYILIGVTISVLLRKPKQRRTEGSSQHRGSWLIYPAMFAIGFYGGFIQVGVGFLFMASLYHLLKLDLVRVNMHKVFIILIYTIPALFVFFFTHNVDLKLGVALGAGNALGAWWSAKISVRKGEVVIRIVLIVAILIMALKLFDIF